MRSDAHIYDLILRYVSSATYLQEVIILSCNTHNVVLLCPVTLEDNPHGVFSFLHAVFLHRVPHTAILFADVEENFLINA